MTNTWCAGSLRVSAFLPGRVTGFKSFFVALVMAGAMWPAVVQGQPRRVIIDTDPGTDDAMALLLALNSPELRVEALTVVPGNTTGKQALENALTILALAGRCDIPVAPGAVRPLAQKLITAEFVHGRNGLGDIPLSVPLARAIRALVRTSLSRWCASRPGRSRSCPSVR